MKMKREEVLRMNVVSLIEGYSEKAKGLLMVAAEDIECMELGDAFKHIEKANDMIEFLLHLNDILGLAHEIEEESSND